MTAPLLTVGHGAAGAEELAALLRGAGVTLVVDVRRYPGSRAHPHTARDEMARWLPAAGVRYRWDGRLGGRRRAGADSPDTWWRVASFRGYAAHMRGEEFRAAVVDLLADVASGRTAVMCSESLWWRCHRRLIADFVTLATDTPVCHLAHDGRLTGHPPSAGARRCADGLLRYDVEAPDRAGPVPAGAPPPAAG
ncbi:MAG TPA: DUF488 domain-containing protein [Pilimelia sp.]|nr:DUF488 domain-containing protein [Pilimelia sp.]